YYVILSFVLVVLIVIFFLIFLSFFFFNDTATTEIYTLSLHDALPISRHVVFTARVIFVGRSFYALTHDSGMNLPGFHDPRVGDWAIGVVQERFWGLPSWVPHLVLLTNFIYWTGETYFIDGSHEIGLLT